VNKKAAELRSLLTFELKEKDIAKALGASQMAVCQRLK
jgi:predicted transcriptional regulator